MERGMTIKEVGNRFEFTPEGFEFDVDSILSCFGLTATANLKSATPDKVVIEGKIDKENFINFIQKIMGPMSHDIVLNQFEPQQKNPNIGTVEIEEYDPKSGKSVVDWLMED